MDINVLVTGANGQLAKTIKGLFLVNTDSINFVFTSKNKLDITKPNQIEAYFSEHNFDYCINCAAYTNVEQAETTPVPAFKVNAEAVNYLARACKQTNTILIHISTDYVFDGEKTEPYTELDETNPVNQYGLSKLIGEQHIKEILDKYFVIRTSWLYSSFGKNFLKTIVNKIQQDEDLLITTSQTGTPTSCIDLAQFILHIIKSKEANYGFYHYTANGEATWYDFAVQISNYFKKYDVSKLRRTKKNNTKASRPRYSVLNNHKANRVFKKEKNWRESVNYVVKYIL